MIFEDITQILTPFFRGNKFVVAEKREGYIKYDYEGLCIVITSDYRDNSIAVYIQIGRNYIAELRDTVMTEFFNDQTRFGNNDTFPADLMNFLNGKGNAILKNDWDTIFRLDDFVKKEASRYTNDLIRRQKLRAADEAWKIKDYAEFMEQIDKMPSDFWPQSYLLKYKFALKHKEPK
jgi:hypothetical protein